MAKIGFLFDPSTVSRPCEYGDFPDLPAIRSMQAKRQWVVWRYEDHGKPKLDKVPYQPSTGFGASVSRPHNWGTYDQAVARAHRGHSDGGTFNGVGLVLAEQDGFTGIDLDNCRDPHTGELSPLAQEVVNLAETYCEVTPSETGLRLIAEGKIPAALKRDPIGVEMYGKGRYLTITGWHVEGTPTEIRPAEKTIALLRAAVERFDAEIAAKRAVEAPKPSGDGMASAALPTREEGGSPYFRNVNSAALANLSAWVPALFGSSARFQPGTQAYRVSSRSLGRQLEEDLSIAPNGIRDWGVADMGDARLGARTPIDLVMQFGEEREPIGAAGWLCRQMGRTPENFGWQADDGRGAVIAEALLTRNVIEAPDGTLADAETGEVLDTPDPNAGELPRELEKPPGLIGALADFICDTSRRPQRALAIGAALTIVGTLAGRHIAGPTGSGTHLYVVGLAPTGAGKDHALQQVLAAMAAAECTHFIGPGQFISMPAVINFLSRAPLSVCAMDEFGSFLKRINSRKASSFEGAISGVLRTAWGSSFKPMPTPEWAGKSAQVILAPALSIYGVSTAEEFYGAMEGGDTSNGVLNRLLVVETRKRPKDRSPRLDDPSFPAALVAALKAVPNRAGPMVFGQLQTPDHAPPVYRVPWGPGAQAEFSELVEEINDLCDGDVMAQAFYARVAETTVRIATILAIGCDASRPVVTLDALRWARGFAMWCARNLQRGGTEHIADSENQSTANAVRRAIREAGGRMKHRDLLRRLNHRVKNRDLHEVIRSLAEAEHVLVEKVTPEKGGPPTLWYSLL
ncbi:DUF3987 domain-containing protein [Methylorubrum populi]|uniref:DNA primase/polymerase bifunctional N-terminal domain-containing protein n=1 Tax=Methylorubrum populi TaxID=223967 RepID=A0A833JAV0_9HYPH|nr:DUF3987 domain-containing protein [Methylorubrum populi]KAB7788019.1 hypothetical protein F8B43_0024 [Methylorubrum populi]